MRALRRLLCRIFGHFFRWTGAHEWDRLTGTVFATYACSDCGTTRVTCCPMSVAESCPRAASLLLQPESHP